jgi:L-amino acid N-acyltransferase
MLPRSTAFEAIMKTPAVSVRDARDEDILAMLGIYNEAVRTTTAVWNETSRTEQEQREWLESKRSQSFPVLVAEQEGELVGFCTFGPFRAWHGYRFTVENSIYVHRDHRRRGVARELLTALITHARAQKLHVMIAGIEAENLASLQLHESVGFMQAAHLHEVGYKFNRWLDLILMELRL